MYVNIIKFFFFNLEILYKNSGSYVFCWIGVYGLLYLLLFVILIMFFDFYLKVLLKFYYSLDKVIELGFLVFNFSNFDVGFIFIA